MFKRIFFILPLLMVSAFICKGEDEDGAKNANVNPMILFIGKQQVSIQDINTILQAHPGISFGGTMTGVATERSRIKKYGIKARRGIAILQLKDSLGNEVELNKVLK